MRFETERQSRTFLSNILLTDTLTLPELPDDDPLHPMTLEEAGNSRKPPAGEAVGGVEGEHQ